MSPRLSSASPTPPPSTTAGPRVQHWSRWLSAYGPVLMMMGLIFVASTNVGTSTHSGRLLRPLLGWLGLRAWLSPARFELVNHYVRKAAHVTEYALLAGLLHRAVVTTRRQALSLRERWVPALVLAVVAAVALYAASDEFHQMFVATRTPSVWDVMLDTAGGAVGLAIKWGWERWRWRSSG